MGGNPVSRMSSREKSPEEADGKAAPRPAILLCVPYGFALDIPFKSALSGREAGGRSFGGRKPDWVSRKAAKTQRTVEKGFQTVHRLALLPGMYW